MALYKEIRQDDGVVTSYHRILFINSALNSHVSIAVVSYIDDESREKDKLSNETSRPYRHAVTYETDYIENITNEQAYDFLKTLPVFEGATDI